jgi:Fe-S-cluster containining protein
VKLDENIARINLDPKTHSIKHATLYVKNLRFQCKRCATFCCKLGGPTLSASDVERLTKAGYCQTEFLEANHNGLKSAADGSCIYLKFDAEKQVYRCAVYDYRPALCRLYPFHFEETGPCCFILKLMPCLGINRRVGVLFDEEFIVARLLDSLKELSFLG